MAKTEERLLPNLLSGARRVGSSKAFKAGLVCAGCYLGSAFDSAVVYPRFNTAILFPQYAILTAALLLSPVRHWWIYLLASALGNYLPHRADSPASWVLLAEAANFSRALVAAIGMRWATPEGSPFDTFRGVVAYLVFAVVVGPFVAAFVGAGVVLLHVEAADFWQIWQAWFLSNALTGVTLLPIIVIGYRNVAAWTRSPNWRRSLEFVALLIGLLLVGILVFVAPYSGTSSLPARLYAPLPFLLWAAVRFGPGGTSIAMLVVTVLASWGVLHEHGPFVTQSFAESVLSLQLFLLAVSLPLMFLVAVMAERDVVTTQQKETDEARHELAHASRLALVGELTASIAHEINQPLGAILSNADAAEMLLDSSPAPLDEIRQILSDIRKDDIRASEVVRRIRTLVQRRATESQMLNLNNEIAEVLGFVSAEASRRGIVVETALAENLPEIRGDKIQLQQVLLNLLMNGMESMTDVVGTRRLFVNTFLHENGTAAIAVTDTGIGIPPHQLTSLFQQFFSTKKNGIGFGLAIARSLVEAHGGKIWAENNPGTGATFTLAIPTESYVTR